MVADAVEHGEGDVVLDAVDGDDALKLAALRHHGDAAGDGAVHGQVFQLLALKQHLPGLKALDAEQQMHQLRAPAADEPGEAEDLAPAEPEADVGKALSVAETAHVQHDRRVGKIAVTPRGVIVVADFAADHGGDDLVKVEVRDLVCQDGHAVAQDRDAVGKAEDLVHAVGDIDDAGALLPEPADDLEQGVRLRLGERGGRLIHHEQLRRDGDGLDRLGDLPARHGELRDLLVGVQVNAVAVQNALRLLAHAAAVGQKPAARRFLAEKHVLRHRERRDEAQLLKDGGDPVLRRLVGRAQLQLPAVEDHRPAVFGHDAHQDLDQRALARAVFADERVDLTAAQGKVDLFQDRHAAVGFFNVPHVQQDVIHRFQCFVSRSFARFF